MSMQSPSLPPEIPKRSLAPVWLGFGGALVIGVVAWRLLAGSSPEAPEARPALAAAPAPAATPAPSAAPPASDPPPPPPPEEEPAPPPPASAIPPAATVGKPELAPKTAPARDPNCDEPCNGKETPELLGAIRAKAGQARSCYERALSNDSGLAGKLEVSVRVGRAGAACSASVETDSLGDAGVKSCVLSRFRSGTYPKPTGGCVNVSVPMNFKPAGSG